MHKLLERLQQEQAKFPPAQRAVASYIVEHYREIPFLTISDIAERIKYSETTISKFCDALGYSGFSSLKKQIAEFVNSEITINKKLERTTQDVKSNKIFDNILADDVASITATLQSATNQENVNKLLGLMDKAQHIYVLGTRMSSFLADLLVFKLRQQGLSTAALSSERGDAIDQMLLIQPDDLVIVFSFFRYTRSTVEQIKFLHKRGIPIVLITDEKLSPAYEYATTVLKCALNTESYIVSYASCISLISAILTANGLKHKKATTEHTKELERYYSEYHTYYGY